jgi:anaerobic selenocysteine-containing dehydrogenase
MSQRGAALAGEYTLALITPADRYFLNSIFANVPKQRRRSGTTTLLIHPDDAARWRITTGDEVARSQCARRAFCRRRCKRSHPPRRGGQHQGPMAWQLE